MMTLLFYRAVRSTTRLCGFHGTLHEILRRIDGVCQDQFCVPEFWGGFGSRGAGGVDTQIRRLKAVPCGKNVQEPDQLFQRNFP